jgi:hypothetical protein
VHSRSARRGQPAYLAGHPAERGRHQSLIDFGTTSAQPAAHACQEPHTAAHAPAEAGKIAVAIEAGQNALSLLIAEDVGFPAVVNTPTAGSGGHPHFHPHAPDPLTRSTIRAVQVSPWMSAQPHKRHSQPR